MKSDVNPYDRCWASYLAQRARRRSTPTVSSSMDISEGLSRVSWKLSCTVLRGGTTGNGDSLLDKDTSSGKQPWYFTARDGSPALTIAGLWDEWKDPETDKPRKSCTMIITEPNEFVREVHDRMPVLLTEKQFDPWLSGEAGVEYLKPAPRWCSAEMAGIEAGQ